MIKQTWAVAALALVVGLGAGCSQKAPAQKSIDAAEQALSQIDEQAQKYIPGKYQAVKAELDTARKDFRDGKYEQAIKVADALPAKAKALGDEAAAARKAIDERLELEWKPLADATPGKIKALEDRIAELNKARRLPKGIDRERVDSASAQVDTVHKAWQGAQDAYAKGDLQDAVGRAKATDLLVLRLMQYLGAAPPDKPAAG